jgi:SAM-dependent methyltransferase
MTFFDELRRFAGQLTHPDRKEDAGTNVESIASMTAAELLAWENRGIPNLDRASDRCETEADERQDLATSLNFPLHWTSARLSWDYLFDFSIACELLAPRPDDLVLDFAAGSCWATELLSRLAVRTVSLDLSLEMMRRGRQRLASDSRLIFRENASFVVGRGQQLPFGDGTFDGVLSLNALHHQPSYAIALREIYRVLKPAGRAVFSEPGTAHAAQALSEYRMREEAILEKPVSLPLIHRLVKEAGFRQMKVVPLRSTAAYVFEYTSTPADAVPLARMWDETLQLGPGEHARFVLYKGEEPADDTLLPMHHLVGRLAARIELERVTDAVKVGEAFVDHLRITNAGSVTWKARGRRFGGQVTCGLKVCDQRGEVIREDLGRTGLARDVRPGEEIRIDMTVAAGLPAGRYELRYDMVVEGVTWFEFHSAPGPRRVLDVLP